MLSIHIALLVIRIKFMTFQVILLLEQDKFATDLHIKAKIWIHAYFFFIASCVNIRSKKEGEIVKNHTQTGFGYYSKWRHLST
jgi:hypothetical protein